MLTYKQISQKYSIPLSLIYRRVHVLKLKGFKKGREIKFKEDQIYQILYYQPQTNSKQFDRRKLAIIEFYEKFGTGNKVSRFLNIHRNVVNQAIREYNETGFVIVESKMNKIEQ